MIYLLVDGNGSALSLSRIARYWSGVSSLVIVKLGRIRGEVVRLKDGEDDVSEEEAEASRRIFEEISVWSTHSNMSSS